MCHMIADSDDELHAMAAKIGVAKRWHQGDHYDICLSKRSLATSFGCCEITLRQCAAMSARRRATGTLGEPDDSVQWLKTKLAQKNRSA